LSDLLIAKGPLIRTHVISGLATICFAHKDQYGPTLKGLSQVDPADNDAVAIAASTLLSNAEKAVVEIPLELKERFTKASKLAAALSSPTGKTRLNRRPGA